MGIDHFPANSMVETHCVGRCVDFQPDCPLCHGECLHGGHHGSADTLPLSLRDNCDRANHAIPVPREIETDGTDGLASIDKNQRKVLGLSVIRMSIVVSRQSAQIE